MDQQALLEEKLNILYQNLTRVLQKISDDDKENEAFEDDSSNAYMYILFVLTFYAFSIVVLMVKYIRREREGSKLEFYYNEFVKREWYKDKNLYDKTGRRIYFTVDQGNNKVVKVASKCSRIISDDPDEILIESNEKITASDAAVVDQVTQDQAETNNKQPVMLCIEDASCSSSLIMSKLEIEGKDFANLLGARPKRGSIKNWLPNKQTSFHQQSLDEALELRNVNSVEDLDNNVEVAKRIDRRLSIDIIGLPPSSKQIKNSRMDRSFSIDISPDDNNQAAAAALDSAAKITASLHLLPT